MTVPGKQGLVVGVADLAVGGAMDGSIITYALGSCIGLTAYDPITRVGGLLHFMLPHPGANAEGRVSKQFMFATTGIPMLFRRLVERGAVQSRVVLTAAGGAEILERASKMAIGSRNRTTMRKVLWKMNLQLAGEDCGGAVARTMSINLEDGSVSVRARSQNRVLWAADNKPVPER
ncbi:MAG: chemotaxis protein CheD [Planctomycetota bacterium]